MSKERLPRREMERIAGKIERELNVLGHKLISIGGAGLWTKPATGNWFIRCSSCQRAAVIRPNGERYGLAIKEPCPKLSAL